jgi:hypothetical protein
MGPSLFSLYAEHVRREPGKHNGDLSAPTHPENCCLFLLPAGASTRAITKDVLGQRTDDYDGDSRPIPEAPDPGRKA